MILLVSGATATVKRWPTVGELIVPGAWSEPDSLRLTPGRWAMDNGAFSGFDAEAFVRMLERFYRRPGCRWVTCPDVVADASETLRKWAPWSKVIRGFGFVPALVLQDGMLAAEVPWSELGAVFVGGTTEWKFSPQARDLCAYAKARGLTVHVGRVNSKQRIIAAARMGADSFDGSQYSMFPDRRIPEGVSDAAFTEEQASLAL